MKYKHGDIFSFPVTEKEFAFGRILLDLETQCLKKKQLKPDTTLNSFLGVLLITIYRDTASSPEDHKTNNVLIDSCFVGCHSFLSSGKWKVVGHQPVNIETLDFPEFVLACGAFDAQFVKGEIGRDFKQRIEETQQLDINPSTFPGMFLDAAYLYMTGRENEIMREVANKKMLDLYAHDLRYSPHRETYLKKANYNPAKTYYETALEAGFDLKRFYE